MPPNRRRRIAKQFLRALRWLAPALLLAAGLAWAGRTLAGADALRVREIAIEGNRYLSDANVELLVDGLRRENILQVDFDRYERRLRDSPWVADVTLFRALPAKVRIRIVERTPLAIARIGQLLYLVDASGVVIDEYTPIYRDFDLPVVDGLVPPRDGRVQVSDTGPLVDPGRAALAQSFWLALEAHPGLRDSLSQIDVSDPLDVVVLLDDDAALLHLGTGRFAERLLRYLDVRKTLQQQFETLDYVDLRFDERVYVRGKKVPAVPAR
jgi:cell division septal protein FtsQ